MAEETTRKITQSYVNALQNRLDRSQVSVYASLAPAYIDGQSRQVIQVCPQDVRTYDAPEGGQIGGYLFRDLTIVLAIWWRLKTDRHQHSQNVLLKAAEGLLDLSNTIRELFDLTTFSGLLTERVSYQGETGTTWYDIDKGVARRDIRFGNRWACTLPVAETLSESDIQPPP